MCSLIPWCTPTDEQKAKIEQTAQTILDVRAKYQSILHHSSLHARYVFFLWTTT